MLVRLPISYPINKILEIFLLSRWEEKLNLTLRKIVQIFDIQNDKIHHRPIILQLIQRIEDLGLHDEFPQ